jgi:hypothetical protein
MLETYVIWSFEHDAWWRPGRQGYTPMLAEAGHYAEQEAMAIVSQANQYASEPMELAVRSWAVTHVVDPDGATLALAFVCPHCRAILLQPTDLIGPYCVRCHDAPDDSP